MKEKPTSGNQGARLIIAVSKKLSIVKQQS